MRNRFLVAFLLSFPTTVIAQVEPDEKTTQAVFKRADEFLTQITKKDFASERQYFSEKLSNIVSPADWRKWRENAIRGTGGIGKYVPHSFIYYKGENLMAAVDFAGRAANRGQYVCGFMLWDIPALDAVGLVRFEENIVPVDALRKMPLQTAAQLMVGWRCPLTMIKEVLGVEVK